MSSANEFSLDHEHSRFKAEVVSTYVAAWARILWTHRSAMGAVTKLRYADLFAGRGMYDGLRSTPLLAIEKLARHRSSASDVEIHLNDACQDVVDDLRCNVAMALSQAGLDNQPSYTCERASIELVRRIKATGSVPTFWFADQFSYSHVTIEMLEAMTEGFGSECALFFDWNGLQRQIRANPRQLRESLGANCAEQMSALFANDAATNRQEDGIRIVAETIMRLDNRRVLPVKLRSRKRGRPDVVHYFLFVTKGPRGLDVMVQTVTAKNPDGVLPFTGDDNRDETVQMVLFDCPPDSAARVRLLAEDIAATQTGTTTLDQLCLDHRDQCVRHMRYDLVASVLEYREALQLLERRRLVDVQRKGRSTAIAKTAILTFTGGAQRGQQLDD